MSAPLRNDDLTSPTIHEDAMEILGGIDRHFGGENPVALAIALSAALIDLAETVGSDPFAILEQVQDGVDSGGIPLISRTATRH